jgi:hypothetical protein
MTQIPPIPCTPCNRSKLGLTSPKRFNAKDFEYSAGFEIIWTSDLADHLLVLDMDDQIKVHIFHHLRVLHQHLQAEL